MNRQKKPKKKKKTGWLCWGQATPLILANLLQIEADEFWSLMVESRFLLFSALAAWCQHQLLDVLKKREVLFRFFY